MSARSAAVALGLALMAASAPLLGQQEPTARNSRLAAECLATAATSILHDVGTSAVGVRLGLGGQDSAGTHWGTPGVSTWLVTLAVARGFGSRGVSVNELRLGVGGRARSGRLTVGLGAEWVRLTLDRASTAGSLAGSGLAARVLGGVDVVRWGQAALLLTLEASLAQLGPGGLGTFVPSAQGGFGLRW